MVDKRYSIFVSSTFRDLVEERQGALKAILALGHFPVGMEVFPAAGDTPWEMISRIISDADYYVLIVAGRYGSTTPEGISYTEREYAEALKLGKQILPFLHEEPTSLPAAKYETDSKSRRKLEQFRKRIMQAHVCKTWKDSNELALHITQSLLNAFDLHPAAGWVRSGGPDAVRLLTEINELRQRVDELKDENAGLREQLKGTSQTRVRDFDADEPVTLYFPLAASPYTPKQIREAVFTWGQVFFTLAPKLFEGAIANRLLDDFANDIISHPSVVASYPEEVRYVTQYDHTLSELKITEESLQALLLGLTARGLVTSRKDWVSSSLMDGRQISTEVFLWYLSPEGQRLYLEQKSI